MIKLAGTVILYNPQKNFIDNIKSYLCFLDKLYLVDNSEIKSQYIEDINNINNAVYIFNNGNKGVAFGLNMALKMALKDGYRFLLTMDQDSSFKDASIEKMIDFINNNNTSDVAIISPEIVVDNHIITDRNTPITSGSIINLDISNKIGFFDEDYFIDRVDFEYALRAKKSGYKIKVITNAFLDHSLGNYKIVKVLNKKIVVTNHLPLRRYYITRNTLYMINDYFLNFPIYSLNQLRMLITDLIKILLFESNKKEKISMMINGFVDFLFNRKGKYGK